MTVEPATITPAHILAEAAADVAATAGAAQPGADQPAAQQPVADPAKEAADLIQFARSLLLPLYPRLESVYTPDVCARLGAAAGPLLAKYGLTLGGIFDRWAPEIGFCIVALPLVRPTIEAMRPEPEPEPKPAGATAAQPSAAVTAEAVKPAADSPMAQFPGLNGAT